MIHALKASQDAHLEGEMDGFVRGDCHRREVSGICCNSAKRAGATHMGQRIRHRVVAVLRAARIASTVRRAQARAVLRIAGADRRGAALDAKDRGHSVAATGRQSAAWRGDLREGHRDHRHALGRDQQRTGLCGERDAGSAIRGSLRGRGAPVGKQVIRLYRSEKSGSSIELQRFKNGTAGG